VHRPALKVCRQVTTRAAPARRRPAEARIATGGALVLKPA
jgi:hypothetical protein